MSQNYGIFISAAISDLNIRPFTRTDQGPAKRLILQGLGEHFGTIDPNLNPDLDNIHANYIVRGDLFLVAEIDHILVGTGGLIQESAGIGRIVRVSVASSHRRQGIGQIITRHLIAEAPDKNYSQLVVETNEDWFDAVRLYLGFGFIEFDRRDGEIHMRKNL